MSSFLSFRRETRTPTLQSPSKMSSFWYKNVQFAPTRLVLKPSKTSTLKPKPLIDQVQKCSVRAYKTSSMVAALPLGNSVVNVCVYMHIYIYVSYVCMYVCVCVCVCV